MAGRFLTDQELDAKHWIKSTFWMTRSAEYSYNHVDRVRIGRNTTSNRDCPNQRSGWRQKSISHSDLITPKSSSNTNHTNLRSSRSLDWNNNINFHEFLSQIEEPEKDYDECCNENYENNNKQRAEYYNNFDIGNDSCSLRRTRSLAVIREETFNDLQINSNNSRRSQLIPRAKLVNRSFFRKRFHQKQRREEDSTGSGVETQTSEARESDDYYANLKRLDSVKIVPPTWQSDKSDLESLNSDYFKNSSHQNNQEDEDNQQQQQPQQQQQRQYQQKKNKSSRPKTNRFKVLDIEVHQDHSQSSAFPETTPSNSDRSDSSSDNIEVEEVKSTEEIICANNIEEFEEVHLEKVLQTDTNHTSFGTITIRKDNNELKPVIAYDSVYLSSEDSSDGTIIEEVFNEKLNNVISAINSECTSLLQISIEDEFNEEIVNKATYKKETENLFTEVKKTIANNSGNTVTTKPKILSVERKLKTLSDYAETTRRGVLEHLTYISTSKVVKSNDITLIDTFRPNLVENQYYSLPDINIGRSLKVSERIDAKLRSTYNISHSENIENGLTREQAAIYDSIKKFGRAHKKARQREYGEVDTLIRASVPSAVDENKLEVLEQPREAPTIEVKAVCKEKEITNNEEDSLNLPEIHTSKIEGEHQGVLIISAPSESLFIGTNEIDHQNKRTEGQEIFNDSDLSDFQINQKTNNFPGQFRIIVTDVQNNVIEEDSIESVPSITEDKKEHKSERPKVNKAKKPEDKVICQDKDKTNRTEEKTVVNSQDKRAPPENFRSKKICRVEKIEKSTVDNNSHNKACRKTSRIFKAHPVKIYSDDLVKGSNTKMSRPQILHVIDSKRCCNPIKEDSTDGSQKKEKKDGGGGVEKEFLEKVDSMRCYWSKLIQDGKDYIVDTTDKNNRNFVTSIEDDSSETNKITPSTQKGISEINSDLHSFTPTVEIVELDGQKQATIVKAHNTENSEFDHVRYKVMKSNLFRNNILTRSKKEAQFDGLLQYLQDYSFQELLTNNNVVIIEPVRTKIEKPSPGEIKPHTVNCKITGGSGTDSKAGTKRHFFYHPVRVNRELLEDELPTPDTVRNVRKFFEESILHKKPQSKMQKSTATDTANNSSIPGHKRRSLRYLTIDTSYGGLRKWDSTSLSSGISSGDLSSPCECNEIEPQEQDHVHVKLQTGEIQDEEEIYSSEENLCDDELCESYYVSEDVLEKIRECGSTVTYYGGRVVDNKSPELSPITKTIIQEIRGGENKCSVCQPNDCPQEKDIQQKLWSKGLGVKFKLVKSNSCSSRLELVGTEKNTESHQTRSQSPSTEPEESVRELVNRLESGAINKAPIPRIIESQCIEKTYRTGGATSIAAASQDSVTINNHLTEDAVGLVDIIKQVTVNNHISFCQSNSTTSNTKTLPSEKINSCSVQSAAVFGGIKKVDDDDGDESTKIQGKKTSPSAQKTNNNNNKICRNKNVDLALNMTKSSSDNVKSEGRGEWVESNLRRTSNQTSDIDIHLINKRESLKDDYEIPEERTTLSDPNKIRAATLLSNNTTALKYDASKSSGVRKEGGGSPALNGVYKLSSNANKIEYNKSRTEADTDDDKLTPIFMTQAWDERKIPSANNRIAPLRENAKGHFVNEESKKTSSSPQRSSKVEAVTTIEDKSFVKHYVANDRNLVQKRKYDDIEFEEFEVYDPATASATSEARNNSATGGGGGGGGNSGGNSGGIAGGSSNSDDCYDSLDDKV